MLSEELHLRVLKALEHDPNISQRALARSLGVSLGKTNYCIKALMAKGWVKARNFKNSQNKLAYAYVLTPSGVQSKAEMTLAFLRRKQREFEKLQQEIEELRSEVRQLEADDLQGEGALK